MDFLERDLEDIIFNADRGELRKRGLDIPENSVLRRQVNLGTYGIADLVSLSYKGLFGKYHRFMVTVYELKQKKVTYSTIGQASRYCLGLLSLLSNYGFHDKDFFFETICIGKECEGGDFVNLVDMSSDIHVFTYGYGVNGIKFHDVCDRGGDDPRFPKSTSLLIKSVIDEFKPANPEYTQNKGLHNSIRQS